MEPPPLEMVTQTQIIYEYFSEHFMPPHTVCHIPVPSIGPSNINKGEQLELRLRKKPE